MQKPVAQHQLQLLAHPRIVGAGNVLQRLLGNRHDQLRARIAFLGKMKPQRRPAQPVGLHPLQRRGQAVFDRVHLLFDGGVVLQTQREQDLGRLGHVAVLGVFAQISPQFVPVLRRRRGVERKIGLGIVAVAHRLQRQVALRRIDLQPIRRPQAQARNHKPAGIEPRIVPEVGRKQRRHSGQHHPLLARAEFDVRQVPGWMSEVAGDLRVDVAVVPRGAERHQRTLPAAVADRRHHPAFLRGLKAGDDRRRPELRIHEVRLVRGREGHARLVQVHAQRKPAQHRAAQDRRHVDFLQFAGIAVGQVGKQVGGFRRGRHPVSRHFNAQSLFAQDLQRLLVLAEANRTEDEPEYLQRLVGSVVQHQVRFLAKRFGAQDHGHQHAIAHHLRLRTAARARLLRRRNDGHARTGAGNYRQAADSINSHGLPFSVTVATLMVLLLHLN